MVATHCYIFSKFVRRRPITPAGYINRLDTTCCGTLAGVEHLKVGP